MHLNLMAPMFPQLDVNIPEGWWKQDAQLDLDFANKRAYNKFTQFRGRPDSILTYTSPSPKMVYGDDGVLRYAPHNVFTYSEQFDNAAWTKAASSVTADSILAPDGTTTADKLIESATTAIHYAYRSFSVTAGVSYTFSVVMKSGERTRAWLYASSVGEAVAYFNLADGTVSATSGTLSPSASVSDLGGGYYRCSITFRPATTASISMGCGPTTASGTTSYAGDGTSGIYLWGAQLNLGSSALTYIPTTSAAVYSLPIDHDPITHAPLGVLIEEQRTNLLTYSEQFDNAAWLTANLVTMAAGTGTAPDGTNTAETVKPNGSAAIHAIYRASTTVVSGTTYALSIYAKANGYNYVALMYHDGASTAGHETIQLFDLANGIVGSSYNTAPDSATIQSVGNGWYRCTITKSWATTSGNISLCPMNVDANPRSSLFAGDTTSGIYLWGAQLEAGSFASSYIQTGSAQVTRASDNITLATSAFNFSGATSTILAESDVDNLIGTHHVFSLHDGSNNERCVLRSINAAMNYAISDGGVLQASNNVPGTVQARQMQSVAFAFAVNDIALSMDGGSITSDTSATLPTVTTLSLGASYYTGLDQLNGHIKRIVVWNTRKSNAELQGLSA